MTCVADKLVDDDTQGTTDEESVEQRNQQTRQSPYIPIPYSMQPHL